MFKETFISTYFYNFNLTNQATQSKSKHHLSKSINYKVITSKTNILSIFILVSWWSMCFLVAFVEVPFYQPWSYTRHWAEASI